MTWKRALLAGVSSALCVFGIAELAGYGVNWLGVRRTQRELSALYEAGSVGARDVEVAAPPISVGGEAPTEPLTPREEAVLTPVPYPDNPLLTVDERFDGVRRSNPDVVGWLSAGGLLSEPVVLRDNEYYMTHDAMGRRNDNGAVFLDVNTDLSARPYTLILYGHNMKSGAMFGCLRNYEYVDFCERHPTIAFNSIYEEGRYVVFSVGRISEQVIDENYVDLFTLGTTCETHVRRSMIDRLKAVSLHRFGVDVRPDDQLLLLVTCTDGADERRVIAARRLRPGEQPDANAAIEKP